MSLPSRKPIGQTIGAYVSSAAECKAVNNLSFHSFHDNDPSVSSTFPPLVLKCDRVWNDDGNFNISVEWEFPASLSLSHITRYILTPSLQSSRNGIIQFYNSTFINSNVRENSKQQQQQTTTTINETQYYDMVPFAFLGKLAKYLLCLLIFIVFIFLINLFIF